MKNITILIAILSHTLIADKNKPLGCPPGQVMKIVKIKSKSPFKKPEYEYKCVKNPERTDDYQPSKPGDGPSGDESEDKPSKKKANNSEILKKTKNSLLAKKQTEANFDKKNSNVKRTPTITLNHSKLNEHSTQIKKSTFKAPVHPHLNTVHQPVFGKTIFKGSKIYPSKKLLATISTSDATNVPTPNTGRTNLANDVTVSSDSVFAINIEIALSDPKSFLDGLNIVLQKIRKLIVLKRDAAKNQNLWSDYFGNRTQTAEKASMFFFPVCLVKGSASQSLCLIFSIENIQLIYGFVPVSTPTDSSSFSGLLSEAAKRRMLFFHRRSLPIVGKTKLTNDDLKADLEPSIYAALGLFTTDPKTDPVQLFGNMIKDLRPAAIPHGTYINRSYDLTGSDASFKSLFQFISGQELNSVESAKNMSAIEFWAKLLSESLRNQNFFERCRKGPSSFVMPRSVIPWNASSIYSSYVEKLKHANTKGRHFLIDYTDGLNLITIYRQ